MRYALYDLKAPKRTVSLTINSDLYSQARDLGINASQVAEEALARAVTALAAEKLKAEIRQDVQALNALVEKHGSFADMLREYNQSDTEEEEEE